MLLLGFAAKAINAAIDRNLSTELEFGEGRRREKQARACYDDEAIYQRNKFDFMVRQ
jgi:hypothetical protein